MRKSLGVVTQDWEEREEKEDVWHVVQGVNENFSVRLWSFLYVSLYVNDTYGLDQLFVRWSCHSLF